MKIIVITENESNQRLDRFLKKLMPQASTGFLQKMLRKKRIKLNGQKSEPSTAITAGDVVQIYFSEETIANFRTDSTKKSWIKTVPFSILFMRIMTCWFSINRPKYSPNRIKPKSFH